MTKREVAIISAYTGFLIGEFKDFCDYAEEIMEKPIFDCEFSYPCIAEEIRYKSKNDFMNIKIEEEIKKSKNQEELGGYNRCKYGNLSEFGIQCKYLRCKYLRSKIDEDNYKFPCPNDSGTDGMRNGVCYEYANFTKK